MGRTAGNSLKFLIFNYQVMQCLDLRNTDFMRENITLFQVISRLHRLLLTISSSFIFMLMNFIIFWKGFPKFVMSSHIQSVFTSQQDHKIDPPVVNLALSRKKLYQSVTEHAQKELGGRKYSLTHIPCTDHQYI